MVGCVIVHDGQIVGEGYHQQYGGPHAEVNAIRSVAKDAQLSESTVYVTLEPCSHYGKTPPCADLLIEKKVKKVVIAATDPNPKVSGRGITKLQSAGIEVLEGVLKEESEELNIRFNTFHRRRRPYVILKWAETSDGFMARENYDSKWISSRYSRQMVHKWRAEEDAILVGFNTAKYDNPKLSVRDWSGQNPLRIVVDWEKQLPSSLHLFDGEIPTVVYNSQEDREKEGVAWVKLERHFPGEDFFANLYNRGIQSLIVEGGAATLRQFISSDNWDEARIFIGEETFGAGVKAPQLRRNISKQHRVMGDILNIYFNR